MTTIITALQTKNVVLKNNAVNRWLYWNKSKSLWCVDEIKKQVHTTLIETDSIEDAVFTLLQGRKP